MTAWRDSLAELRRNNTPAILVSVDSIVGSTPREPGARMVVTAAHLYGSIGGGNLEYQACQIARQQLLGDGDEGLRRFPLGAGLGQCCGGLVNLMFERLLDQQGWDKAAGEEKRLPLYLFGAGHVGSAVVRVMQDLPLEIHWVDSRDDMLPAVLPVGVQAICSDTPEAEVDAAPPQSCFLVMTHDHALDQRLCEQILKRDDFVYFGLIGSRAKRRMFETRMRRRGIDAGKFERMICPIGIDGISSKKPALIAIAVAAEIMQIYDAHLDGRCGEQRLHLMEGVS